MKKYLFLLACFGLLMAQCHKNDDKFIKVSGKVLEFGSNKPISNAKVGIYEEGGAFLGTTWTKLVDTTRTDANGFYSIEKNNIDRSSSFFIAAAANKYYTYDPNNYLVTGQEVTNNNIVLDPFAWIKVHVKNVNPFNDRDSILLGNVVGTIPMTHVGKNIELNYINKVRGNLRMEAQWSVGKNSIWKFLTDSIRIQAHDTLNYEILY
jgi:hypothetical protein